MSSRLPASVAVLVSFPGLCLFGAAARADEPATVVVSAARQAQPLADTLPHTTVLSRAEIERAQAVDLASLLAAEAGVQLAFTGGRGSPTSLFVRGAESRQVLVLVDGVPLARQDLTGQVGLEHLMLDAVERIEIVRGNVSALYGSGAIGGVIQVFTRDADAPFSARAEAGSRDFLLGAARASGRAGDTSWSVALGANRDRGFSAIDSVQKPAANPDRDGYRNTSATLKLAQRFAADHELVAAWTHVDGRLDYDSAFATPADVQASRTHKDIAQLALHSAFAPHWRSELTLATQRDRVENDESGAAGYHSRYDTRNDQFAWRHTWDATPGVRWVGGVEQFHQSIVADDGFGGYIDRSRPVSALYAGGETRAGRFDAALHLRYDRIGGVGSSPTARVGLGWQADAQWKFIASLANAFAAPPLAYLYQPWYGNPDLKAERSTSAEIGAQWVGAGQRLRATLFDTRVRNQLEYDSTAQRFMNIGRSRNYGVELSHGGRLGALDWRASLTVQHAVDADTGQRLLRRSNRLASVTAGREFGGGRQAAVVWRAADARPDFGGVTLAGYGVVDCSVQWRFAPDWQWTLRVENLGDARYQTAFGYNQPPRGFFTGLRWAARS